MRALNLFLARTVLYAVVCKQNQRVHSTERSVCAYANTFYRIRYGATAGLVTFYRIRYGATAGLVTFYRICATAI